MTGDAAAAVPLEALLGRRVRADDGRVVGRLEEIRAERRGGNHEVTEFLIGPGALLERLSIVRRFAGSGSRMRVARWDQIDISNPLAPRLTCGVENLKIERPRSG